jgi:hypothetical protein
MVLEENWSASPERVRQFLLSQPDIIEKSDEFFWCACRITLTPVPGTLLGKWEHTRTLLRIEGPESDINHIHRRIFLQFLSAGG